MAIRIASVMIAASLISTGAVAGELEGPGRFCGYSPIIDLVAGEKIVTLDGGIHGGSFRWEGPFGTLDVYGIGWAGRPKGRMLPGLTSKRHYRFQQRRDDGKYRVAIWNGKHGAAYFSSPEAFDSRAVGGNRSSGSVRRVFR
ncbi:MAG: hypothetical protein V4530_16265 [Pseudomonadota bacterium]